MDSPGELSEDVGRGNLHHHATFDLGESSSRVPLEEATDKEEPHGENPKVHFSEDLDDKRSGIKRSSTYPFSKHGMGHVNIKNDPFESVQLQGEREQSETGVQSERHVSPFRSPFERTRTQSTTNSSTMRNNDDKHSYHRSGSRTLRSASAPHRIQLYDELDIADLDSDILSSDEDAASDTISSSSLAFDFTSVAPRPEIRDDLVTVHEAPVPKMPTNKMSKWSNETTHKVLVSQYDSSTFRRSDSTAKLSVGQPAETQDNQSEQLMRWIHLQSKYPSFDAFLEFVSQLPTLIGPQRIEAIKVLESARDNSERPIMTPKGVKGKYMDTTTCFTESGKVLLSCFPYFCLAPYSRDLSFNNTYVHPMRTLLQWTKSSIPKQRDMQQAVCKLNELRNDRCFHVPQIWCLIIRKDLLITCGHLTDQEIRRDLVTIQPVPMPSGNPKTHYLRISNGGNRTWILSPEDCDTWLAFIAHFHELSEDFNTEMKVIDHGIVRNADNWSAVIEHARVMTVDLNLQFKKSEISYDASISEDSSIALSSDEEELKPSSTGSEIPNSANTPLFNLQSKKPESFVASREAINLEASNPDKYVSTAIQARLGIFHVFHWFVASPKEPQSNREACGSGLEQNIPHFLQPEETDGKSFDVDLEKLKKVFQEMHRMLRTRIGEIHRLYRSCPSRSLEELEDRLRTADKTGEPQIRPPNGSHNSVDPNRSQNTGAGINTGPSTEDIERIKEDNITKIDSDLRRHKRRLVIDAKRCFGFFLPLKYSSDMVSKYWGAVYAMIDDDVKFSKYLVDNDIRDRLAGLLGLIDQITHEMSHGTVPFPYNLTLPTTFPGAWLQLVACFTFMANGDYYSARTKLHDCFGSLYKGRKDLMRSLASNPIQEKEAVLPLGVAVLLLKNLQRDITLGSPDVGNILSTYHAYYDVLTNEMRVNPYSRSYQEKLMLFREEVEAVLKILKSQAECFALLKLFLNQTSDKYVVPNQRWRETYIIQDSIDSIHGKIESFDEMYSGADDLAKFNIRRIESSKDRQDAAILVFTTVTIVFLPLSFVASIFGMNTFDIRNLNRSQWLFWVCAIPFTIVVMGLSVLIVQNLESLRQLWTTFVDRRAGDSGLLDEETDQEQEEGEEEMDD